MLNLQGDVIAVLDSSGGYAAWYVYDAWGKVLTVRGTDTALANANPIRYRGYYYDSETGFYYLGSRYYDPAIKRFINADSANLIAATPYGLANKNLFSYCSNNPVNQADDGGEFGHIVVGAIVGAAISLASQVVMENKTSISEIDWADVGASAISGGLAASGVGLAGQIVGNAVIGGVGNIASQMLSGTSVSNINWANTAAAVAGGAASGAIGGSGLNKNGTFTKAVTYTKSKISREIRRINQKYATKVLKKIVVPYIKKNIIKPAAIAIGRLTAGSVYSRYYYRRSSAR